MSHWKLQGKQIVAFVRSDESHTPIADILFGEKRPVAQMLRYAQLGEQLESVIDKFSWIQFDDTLTYEEKARKNRQLLLLVQRYTRQAITDAMANPAKCEEIKP